MPLMLMQSTARMASGEIIFQHHFQMNLGGLFVMYLISLLNLRRRFSDIKSKYALRLE